MTTLTATASAFPEFKEKRYGVLWGILAAIALGMMNFLVKFSLETIPSSEAVFARGLIGMLLLTPLIYTKIPILLTRTGTILWIRCIGGGISVLCLFYNLQRIGVGDATALINLSTLFVVTFSWLVLKEAVSKIEWSGIGAIILGALILQSPFGSGLPLAAVLIGLLGAVTASIAYIALRQAAQRFSPLFVVWGFCFVSALVSLCFPSQPWNIPDLPHFLLLIVMGLLGLAGQIWMTYAYMQLSAALACALSLSSLIWGLTFESLYLMSIPKPIAFLSYGFILVGVYILQVQHRGKRT